LRLIFRGRQAKGRLMQLTIRAAVLILAATLAGSGRAQDLDMLEVEVKEESDLKLIISRLNGDDPKAQEQSLGNLELCGRTAWPAASALGHVVDGSTAQNKLWALNRLADLECEATPAIPAISRALRDGDPHVRSKAGYCLLRINAGDREAACRALSAALRGKGFTFNERLEALRKLCGLSVRARATVPILLEIARDTHEAELFRSEAARAIGWIGPEPRPALLEALRAMLRQGPPLLRVEAAWALWRLDEPGESLVSALVDVIRGYRPPQHGDETKELFWGWDAPVAQAGRLLGEIGPEAKSAIPMLITALQQKRPIVRLAAIHALGGMGAEARPAIEGLGKCLEEAEPFSMPMAHHDYCVSDDAAAALQQIGPQSTDTLLRALAGKQARVRINAAKALGNLPDLQGRIVVAMTKLLDDPEPWIRGAAVDALGKLGGDRAFRALASRLNDQGGWTSFPSAAGGIGTGHSIGDEILKVLATNDPDLKTLVPAIVAALASSHKLPPAMITVLRRLGPDAIMAAPLIAPLLKDPRQRLDAAITLARISPDHPGLLQILLEAVEYGPTVAGARGVGDLGPRARSAVPLLKIRLNRGEFSRSERAVIVAAIVKLDPADAASVIELATALQEEPGIFRASGHDEAEETWKRLGRNARPAINLLVEGCRYQPPGHDGTFFDAAESETSKRRHTAELLIEVGAKIPRAVDTLIDVTRQSQCDDRGMAADALGRLGPAAAHACSALIAMLPDDEIYILGGDFHGNGGTHYFPGERAMLALSKIGLPALTPLRNALRDEEPLTRRRAAMALGLIGRAARPAAGGLIELLEDSHRAIRAAAAASLGVIGATDEPSVAALTRCLSDQERIVRVAAAKALGKVGRAASRAIPALSHLQNDSYGSVRDAVRNALSEIGP
jgi:HEAT repeat protein